MQRTVLLVALSACQTEDIVVGELAEVAELKAIPNRNLDILFVVDNSGSMADKQNDLALNFPLMMDKLSELDGGLPNLHIGVVTSDMGTSGGNGELPGPAVGQIGTGGCASTGDDGELFGSPAMTELFISDVDDGAGGRVRNYTGELRAVFSGIALVGVNGCGFEQHLSAMRRALSNTTNTGFLRPEANLAVVIIADEDDCSVLDPDFFTSATSEFGPLQSFRCTRLGVRCDPDMSTVGDKSNCGPEPDSLFVEDVQPFVDGLISYKGDERMIMVAGIVGDPDPVAIEERTINAETQLALAHSCTYTGALGQAVADPGVRLSAFLDAFPERSTLTSICSNDLSAPLTEIGSSAKKLQGDPCLDTSQLADASPDPGIQPACEVVDIRDSAPDAPQVLPSCTSGAADCYELIPDSRACPASTDHLRIRFQRSFVTDDMWTSVRCQPRA